MADMLQTGKWRFSPELHRQMIEAAVVARADLKVKEQRQYIFMITDFGFCGTAGCAMLIGEIHEDGNCHEIYDGSGFKHATEILGRRDHGYRRLYTPCELRFDGHEYRQIRDECPNPDVQR